MGSQSELPVGKNLMAGHEVSEHAIEGGVKHLHVRHLVGEANNPE